MGYRIKPNMTPGRLAWLLRLRDDGPQPRPRGRVGFDCLELGWSEWANNDHINERITDAGKLALKEAGYDGKNK